MDFYVYVYLDHRKEGCFKYGKSGEFEFNYEPFYVGKGKGKRKDCHIRECNIRQDRNRYKNNKINKLKRLGLLPIVIVIKDKMEESGAFQLEKDVIKAIGRADKKIGPLTNLTDGGEGASGVIVSQEAKDKIRNWHLGKPMSEEAKKNMSISQKERHDNMTKEEKKAYSDKMKKVWYTYDEETKTKMKTNLTIQKEIDNRGEKNPNFGNRWNDTQRKKLSDHQKVHSVFVTNNPQKLNPNSGRKCSMCKYVYAVYDLTGKLIIKTDKIKEITKMYSYMKEQCIRKMTKTSNFYKGMYVDRVLLEDENTIQDVIIDEEILSKMKNYGFRYNAGLGIGRNRTNSNLYNYKIYKDGILETSTINRSEISNKYGIELLKYINKLSIGKIANRLGYTVCKEKISEDI